MSPGRVAYVVCIPKAMSEPHQANDHKYYRRKIFKSEPMEHYEVMDIIRRGETPEIEVNITIDPPIEKLNYKYSKSNSGKSENTSYDLFNLKISLTNCSIEPANYAMVFLYIDSRIHRQSSLNNFFKEIGRKEIRIKKRTFDTIIHQYNHHVSKHMPIFKGKALPVFFCNLFIPEKYDGKIESFGIFIEVAVPKMGIRNKSYLFNLKENNKIDLKAITERK